MVITIDDLDRCSPKKIVNMLEAVHLLLEIPGQPVILLLAIDPRIIIAAVEDNWGEVQREQVCRHTISCNCMYLCGQHSLTILTVQ